MKTSAPKRVCAKIQKRRSINEILRAAYRRSTRDKIMGLDHENLTFRNAGCDFHLSDVVGEEGRDIFA